MRNKIIEGTFWAGISNGLSALISLITLTILARWMGPDTFGVFTLAWSIITVFTFLADFGVGRSVSSLLARDISAGGTAVRKILQNGLSIISVSGLIFSIICFTTAGLIGRWFNEPRLVFPLMLGAVVPLLSSLIDMAGYVFQSVTNVRIMALLTLLEFLAKLIWAVVLVYLGFGVPGALIGHSIAVILVSIGSLWLVFKRFYPKFPEARSQSFIIPIIRYCIPFLTISFAMYAYTELSGILIGFFASTTEVGYYGVAKTLSRLLTLVAVSLGVAIGPTFVQLKARSPQYLGTSFIKVINNSAAILIPVSALVWGLSDILVSTIYGKDYAPAAIMLKILVPYVTASGISAIVNTISDYMGKAKFRAVSLVITVVAYLIVCFFLIPRYGGQGAAWSVLITYVPYSIVNVYYVSRLCSVNLKVLVKQLIKIFMLSALMISVFILLPARSISLAILDSCISLFVYFVGLLLMKELLLSELQSIMRSLLQKEA